MAKENEDLDILIEEDKAPELKVEAKKPGEEVVVAQKAVGADEGLDDLKAKLDESKRTAEQERQGRLAAERQRDAAASAAHEAKVETHDSNLALVTNAIANVKSAQELLKGRYKAAREAGDIDAEADVLAEMQTKAAELLQLEQGKVAMEAAPKPEPVKPQSTDRVEQVASQMTPRSAAWVRAHPQFVRDDRLFQRMLAAHNLAVTDGLDADSDEYFAAVEATLGVKRGDPVLEDDDGTAGAARVTQRRESPPPAAPPGGGGSNLDGKRPNVVRLSADEREIAKMNGMTDQEYARNKQQLQREGRLTTH